MLAWQTRVARSSACWRIEVGADSLRGAAANGVDGEHILGRVLTLDGEESDPLLATHSADPLSLVTTLQARYPGVNNVTGRSSHDASLGSLLNLLHE